jgi:hypothetical protein
MVAVMDTLILYAIVGGLAVEFLDVFNALRTQEDPDGAGRGDLPISRAWLLG